MTDPREIRLCNVCGESWFDTGDYQCPYCQSEDTEVLTEEGDDVVYDDEEDYYEEEEDYGDSEY